MYYYELATDEDGEPFGLPATATGWRVKRKAPNGAGRPKLVRWRNGADHGHPMVVPLATTHAELLEAAGPGRYRLEPVGADRKAIADAPVASTGYLGEHEDDDLDDEGESPKGKPRPESYDLFAHFLENSQRMTASALQQTTAVLQGAAQLLAAAHSSGITTRPAPAPSPVYVAMPAAPEPDPDEDDDGDPDEDSPSGVLSVGPPVASGVPEFVQMIVKEAMQVLVPLVVQKLATVRSIAGVPTEALSDWRKAAPERFPSAWPMDPPARVYPAPSHDWVQSAPSPVSAPTVIAPFTPAWVAPSPPLQGAPSWPSEPSEVRPSPPSVRAPVAPSPDREELARVPRATAASADLLSAPVIAPAMTDNAGAASPSAEPREAVPAEADQLADAAGALDAYFLRVWQALTEPEQTRAANLLARLPAEARTAIIAELSLLPFDRAVARAREIIRGRPTPASG